jgi:ribonuclease-3 family protein
MTAGAGTRTGAGLGRPSCPPADISPVTLAYIGDAVYTLHVRTRVACRGPAKQRDLHRLATDEVRAAAQARTLARLEDKLSDEERCVVRWARNAKIGRGGGGTVAERHLATGFEALLGHLYLTGQDARLEELLSAVIDRADDQAHDHERDHNDDHERATQAGGSQDASSPA